MKRHCLHFEPGYTTEVIIAMINFTSNQLLMISNFKYFYSSTIDADIIINPSHCNKSFLIMEEVDLNYSVFTFIDNRLNFCDFLDWIKVMILYAELYSSPLACLAIP